MKGGRAHLRHAWPVLEQEEREAGVPSLPFPTADEALPSTMFPFEVVSATHTKSGSGTGSGFSQTGFRIRSRATGQQADQAISSYNQEICFR